MVSRSTTTDFRSLEEGRICFALPWDYDHPTTHEELQRTVDQCHFSGESEISADLMCVDDQEQNVNGARVATNFYRDPSMNNLCGSGDELSVQFQPGADSPSASRLAVFEGFQGAQRASQDFSRRGSDASHLSNNSDLEVQLPSSADYGDVSGSERILVLENGRFVADSSSDSEPDTEGRANFVSDASVPVPMEMNIDDAHEWISRSVRLPHLTAHSGPLPQRDHKYNNVLESDRGGVRLQQPRRNSCDEKRTSHEMRTSSSEMAGPRSRKGNYGLFRTHSVTGFRSTPRASLEQEQSWASNAETSAEIQVLEEGEVSRSVSAGRYFDALKGPELETPKESEDLLLPSDELWPFLLRFPIGAFRISLGLGCQSVLWRDLHDIPIMSEFHIPLAIHVGIWWVALATLIALSVTYIAKCAVYFEAVRREFHHPVRVNYFFTPWIAGMFLAQSVPAGAGAVGSTVWAALIVPVIALELKFYGQWLSGGERRLSKIANPSTHLAVVGNFVGAKLASSVGFSEVAILLWAVGFAHYLVLFVTLYQRLPSSNVILAKELHPIYFLFVAVPSSASVSWKFISGSFGNVSKIFFFISLFIYALLGIRLNFFRGARFSVAWWAYTFPMSAAAVASIHYSQQVPCLVSKGLAVFLSLVASLTVLALFCMTFLHAVVWQSLFPNDMAIAIAATKHHGKLVIRKHSCASIRRAALPAKCGENYHTYPDFTVNVQPWKTSAPNLAKLFPTAHDADGCRVMDR